MRQRYKLTCNLQLYNLGNIFFYTLIYFLDAFGKLKNKTIKKSSHSFLKEAELFVSIISIKKYLEAIDEYYKKNMCTIGK